MPTSDHRRRLRLGDVRDVVAAATFPRRGDLPDRIGLEVEVFPIVSSRGAATCRLPLREALATVHRWAGTTPPSADPFTPVVLPDGTRITFEPGGQVEVSGACARSASAAAAGVADTLAALAREFARDGVVLASAGIDLWHDVGDVPQQLTAARYPAMAAYLAERSDAGAWMMRNTCSVQINLDPGTGTVARERWLVANLAAPLAIASFATSPAVPSGVTSQRAGLWRRLDPTRTGVPTGLVAGEDDPVEQLVRAALEADVLLVRTTDGAVPGWPGVAFGSWMQHGHPDHGWPTVEDLAYHLTTLFHEVRPRGALEVRSIDALPATWRVVPAVLYAGMLYDEQARHRIVDVLAAGRSRLPRMLELAGAVGVSDASLCATAVETWSYAVEGARRLGPDIVDTADVRRAEAFIDRFTMRGRCPGDELRALMTDDPAAALAWATEPVPTVALC